MTALVYTLVLLYGSALGDPAHTKTIQGNISTLAECNRLGHKLYDTDTNPLPWECVETKVAIPVVGK